MPTLNWIGKDAVVNHHQQVPFRTLERKYSFGNADDNMIIHGDNLEALKALLPKYEGRIKCIYIDPPYNTGNEGWVYNDNVNSPKIKKWLGQVVGKETDDLTRHDKWLCMMYPRLKLLQKLLSDDGAIFISIDDNELFLLKCICDEIFGSSNFLCNVCIKNDSRARPYDSISISHEYLVIYTGNGFISNQLHDKTKKFQYSDEIGGYDLYELRNRNSDFNIDNRPNLYYPFWVNPNNEIEKSLFEIDLVEHNGWIKFYPQESQGIKTVWRWGKERSQQNLNTLIFGKKATGGWQVVKKYRDDSYALPSVWDEAEFSSDRGTLTLKKYFDNKRVFSFPKSPELIQRCLELASFKDSIVLDSFAGSGTTAHAVLNLNKQDGGNRKFILVEMEDYAENITAERVRRVIKGYGKDKNAVEGTGGGFTFYELGETVFNADGYLNEAVGTEKLREYLWYTETHEPYVGLSYNGSRNENDGRLSHCGSPTNNYLLGNHNGTAYYFYYEPDRTTTLDKAFLNTIAQKAEQYVIYADNCLLSDSFMQLNHIVFKKIPRDIRKF
ncbi:MAG: site-specific DNA-methyltransferase [Salinivirgaceae bacterium]|nr:site-specific DNA-methyltransferase [Salinivirgaceae bacterium]